jgi:hypothetical protein
MGAHEDALAEALGSSWTPEAAQAVLDRLHERGYAIVPTPHDQTPAQEDALAGTFYAGTLYISGPHPEGATSRWLVRFGDTLMAVDAIEPPSGYTLAPTPPDPTPAQGMPTTEAGRALVQRLSKDEYDGWREWAIAIEQQAAAAERARLRAIIEQTIETLRAEDPDGESRSIRVGIAAREHVLSFLADPEPRP